MQRRLTAILSADVADYSGLMEADEAGTLDGFGRHPRSSALQGDARGGRNASGAIVMTPRPMLRNKPFWEMSRH